MPGYKVAILNNLLLGFELIIRYSNLQGDSVSYKSAKKIFKIVKCCLAVKVRASMA